MSRGHYFGVPGTNWFYRKNMSFVVLKKQIYFPSFMLESLDKVLWYHTLLFFFKIGKNQKSVPGTKNNILAFLKILIHYLGPKSNFIEVL